MPFGLKKTADVCIEVSSVSSGFSVRFVGQVPEVVLSEFEALKGLGWQVFSVPTPYELFPPRSEDRFAVAERIASSLEVDFGLTVVRMVIDPNRPYDSKSRTKSVQSFILH